MSEYEEENAFFTDSDQSSEIEEYYEDYFATSSHICAIFADDVERLQQLIKSTKSINIESHNGNTLLHLAVLKNRIKVFDYLLTVDEVKIDAKNLYGETPLFVALNCHNEYCAIKLIEKGADVNATCKLGFAPLHWAVYNSLNVGRLLIENGADINACNHYGKTPIYIACNNGKCDVIHMLLYYLADITIPSNEGILPFDLVLAKCPEQLQEICFDYVFDQEKIPVNLRTLTEAMKARSPVFMKIIDKTSEVLYNENDLKYLRDSISSIDSILLKIFFEKFEEVFKDMIQLGDSLWDYYRMLVWNEQNFVDFLYLLFDRPLISTMISNFHVEEHLISLLINLKISEDTLTKLVCCLLSHGFNIVSDDLNNVYRLYGFCELFKIMLHMDYHEYPSETYSAAALMPTLIHDVNFTEKCLAEPEKYISLNGLQKLMRFFALSKLKIYGLKHYADNKKVMNKINNVRTVPSLLESGRNAARKYIIRKYNVKKSVHFFTVLKWLPISDVYKAILSYEKEIYMC